MPATKTKTSASFELLSIESIEIDKKNPRIALFLSHYKEDPTPEAIHLALRGNAYDSFLALKESIRVNGTLIHPIIVNRESSKKLTVIEGNTRLMLYRDFKKDGIKGDWGRIPCMVHEGLSQAAIDAIRLQSHLVGPRQWDPYSKARYLHHLSTQPDLTFEQLVEFCGGQRSQVQNFIGAYQDMEAHYRKVAEKKGQEFNPEKYSSFELLQNSKIHQSIITAGFDKSDFAEWVADDLFDRQEHIRRLPSILQNPRAREALFKDGSNAAIKLLDIGTPDPKLDSASLHQLALAMERKARSIPLEEIKRLRETVGSEENEALIQSRDRLIDLCKEIATDE